MNEQPVVQEYPPVKTPATGLIRENCTSNSRFQCYDSMDEISEFHQPIAGNSDDFVRNFDKAHGFLFSITPLRDIDVVCLDWLLGTTINPFVDIQKWKVTFSLQNPFNRDANRIESQILCTQQNEIIDKFHHPEYHHYHELFNSTDLEKERAYVRTEIQGISLFRNCEYFCYLQTNNWHEAYVRRCRGLASESWAQIQKMGDSNRHMTLKCIGSIRGSFPSWRLVKQDISLFVRIFTKDMDPSSIGTLKSFSRGCDVSFFHQ